MFSSISMDDFLKSNIETNIIDIRSMESYNNNHIPGAINIPYEKLLASPSTYLNEDIRYYIYCSVGLTGKKICQILSKKGYKVTNIAGGYQEWILKK